MVEIHGELHAGEATLTEVDSKKESHLCRRTKICRIIMREDETLLCVTAIIYFGKIDLFSYKNHLFQALKLPRLKSYFPCVAH